MILALLLACGLAWLVCERQSRVYARHDAWDRADAGWNALQPPVAAGGKVWLEDRRVAAECAHALRPQHGPLECLWGPHDGETVPAPPPGYVRAGRYAIHDPEEANPETREAA